LLGHRCGSLLDRHSIRKLLLGVQATATALAFGLALAAATHAVSIGMLLVFATANGCVSALGGPAVQVYPVDLVGEERVLSAVTLNEIVANTSRVVGPAVAVAWLSVAGVTTCFLVNAISFLPTMVVLWTNGEVGGGLSIT
jgi:MFS family permease